MSRLIWIALVLLITVYVGHGTATRAQEMIEVDTIINITSKAGVPVVTTQEALDAVAKANEILKQADIKLNVKRVNDPTSQASKAGNSDGNSSYTDGDEDQKALEAGGKELDSAVGAGKGIKIYFTDVPWEGTTTPGWSIHENRTMLVKKRATTQQTGETIAHECGHILTLSKGHAITTTKVADDEGHAAQNDNFMAPSNRRTGTNVTTSQAVEMRRKARTLGSAVTQPSTTAPATSRPHGSGGRQDRKKDCCECLGVSQVGTGGALTSSAHPVVVRRYSLTNLGLLGSIPLPTAPSGSGNRALTLSGTATSEGILNLSTDCRYLLLAGYNAAPGTPNVATSPSSTINRVVGRIDADSQVDTTTAFDAYSGGNIRSAVSLDGHSIWTAGTGTDSGVRYTTLGSTSTVELNNTVTNTRVVDIFNLGFGDQLFVSTMTGTNRGVNTVGVPPPPTTGGQPITLLPGFDPSNTSPESAYNFWFADANTLYVADDRNTPIGGIQKWQGGGPWTLVYTMSSGLGSSGVRGLTGIWKGSGQVVLYAITAEAGANRLMEVTDVGPSSTFVTRAAAPPDTRFRGVDRAPFSDLNNPVRSAAALDYAHAYHCCDEPEISLLLATEELIDPLPVGVWRYLWLFDADRNPATGRNVMGFAGIETGVSITLNIGGGTISSNVSLEDYVALTSMPLSPAIVTQELKHDPFDDDSPAPERQTTIKVFAPYAPLSFTATDVPTAVVSVYPLRDIGLDEITFDFHTDFESGRPQLSVSPTVASGGQSVSFAGSGFTPSSTGLLMLDDTTVQTGIPVQPDGSVSGAFTMPIDPPATGTYFFVTLHDDGGQSGFNVIHRAVPCLRGDLNDNGSVNGADAPALAAALLAASVDPDTFCRADVNEDGDLTGEDIQAYVDLIVP